LAGELAARDPERSEEPAAEHKLRLLQTAGRHLLECLPHQHYDANNGFGRVGRLVFRAAMTGCHLVNKTISCIIGASGTHHGTMSFCKMAGDASDRLIVYVLRDDVVRWSANIECIMQAQELRNSARYHGRSRREELAVRCAGLEQWIETETARAVELERKLDNAITSCMVSKTAVEVNPKYSILLEFKKKAAAGISEKTLKDLVDTSLLTFGFNVDEHTQFDNSMTSYMGSKTTIEISPKHSIMLEIKKKAAADTPKTTVKDLIWLLFDTPLLTSGFNWDMGRSAQHQRRVCVPHLPANTPCPGCP